MIESAVHPVDYACDLERLIPIALSGAGGRERLLHRREGEWHGRHRPCTRRTGTPHRNLPAATAMPRSNVLISDTPRRRHEAM